MRRGLISVIGCLLPISTACFASSAFDYAVMCGGNLLGGGNTDYGTTAPATIHCNGYLLLNGSGSLSVDVEASTSIRLLGSYGIIGDTIAPAYSNGTVDNITGTVITSTVPVVTMPFIDMLAYSNLALSTGLVFTGNQTWTNIPAGYPIIWINGSLRLSGGINSSTCSVFAAGNINVTSSGDRFAPTGFPLFVSVTGDVDIYSGAIHSGMIYAPSGDVEKGGGGVFAGQVIAADDCALNGAWDQWIYVRSVPKFTSPGMTMGTGQHNRHIWNTLPLSATIGITGYVQQAVFMIKGDGEPTWSSLAPGQSGMGTTISLNWNSSTVAVDQIYDLCAVGTTIHGQSYTSSVIRVKTVSTNDTDADGLADWQELLAGSNPSNAASAFGIIEQNNGGREIRWLSTTSAVYQVQLSTNLHSSTWTILLTTNGTGSEMSFTDPVSTPPRFLRVAVNGRDL